MKTDKTNLKGTGICRTLSTLAAVAAFAATA